MHSLTPSQKIPLILFGILTGLFYGIIASAQVLSFLGLYKGPLLIAAASLGTACLAAALYFRQAPPAFFPSLFHPDPAAPARPRLWDRLLLAGGLILLVLMILVPLVRWPDSPVNETLHWDAAAYHFPKAVELYKSGTAWDFSYAYAEYPSGYESLLAFGLAVTQDEALFGTVHALIALYLFVTLWLLARRYTALPGGLLCFLISLILFSGRVWAEGNPFWIFGDLVFMIGKNDLLLGICGLALILHAPVGSRPGKAAFHPLALALLTMIALSIKPNGLFIALPLWLLALFEMAKAARSQPWWSRIPWKSLALYAVLIVPGVLWAVRNLILIRGVFYDWTYDMQAWSIANNLTNPGLYLHLPKLFILVSGVIVLAAAAAIFRRLSGWYVLVLVLLFAGFLITPESAFFGGDPNQAPTNFAWRFAIALLGMVFLTLLIFAEELFMMARSAISRMSVPRTIGAVKPYLQAGAACAGLILAGWIIYHNDGLLAVNAKNRIVLADQFRDPVGVDGYHSAYDYFRKNVRNATVQVDNGLPYYLYGPGFTNIPNRLKYPAQGSGSASAAGPEYYVVFKTVWWGQGEGSYPEGVGAAGWADRWQLIYEDQQGRIYQAK